VNPFPTGTLVVVNNRLGRIVKEARLGGAAGYNVTCEREDSTEGYLPHFAEVHSVQAAELGVNVCRHKRGTHWCGLLHITNPEWLATPNAPLKAAA
jgi:hypothetical protein